jgi:hypothetical protein
MDLKLGASGSGKSVKRLAIFLLGGEELSAVPLAGARGSVLKRHTKTVRML